MSRTPHAALLAAAIAALLALPACSDDGDITAVGSTTTRAADSPTTTVDDSGEVDTTKETIDVDDPSWAANATQYRGRDGERFDQVCPPNPEEAAGSVWGANTYTDDSSICTAAVHAGLITFAEGGTATYEIAPGKDSYASAISNGVTSTRYGAWGGSFVFPDADEIAVGADPARWGDNALGRGPAGTTFTVDCPAGGSPGSIWGSGPYTGDSSICTAAVHAGIITLDDGGSVTALVGGPQDSYEGSDRNGIQTGDWGAYDPSFTIVGPG